MGENGMLLTVNYKWMGNVPRITQRGLSLISFDISHVYRACASYGDDSQACA